ncbi:beta-lactamase family protein [Culicoidibacter larvae]|uniref:Beta-lactamase family protein n=2 Tax=Culicoidibacter larvae TaxID=2579976 RepID=A0A5R8Q8K0_9FIRM|nr:beta-lactamase family protein [Culicoidibacter larvae]
MQLIPEDFSGVIHVANNNAVIFNQAYGYADIANQRKNNLETRFGSASAGKVFVATAILMLITDGRLNFTDTIGERLPIDWQQINPKITVEQLLTHTSGIPDYFDEDELDDYAELFIDFPNYRLRKNADLVPLFIEKPMKSESGTIFNYSNSGYVVLAAIIEQVTGMAFDQYLQQTIFEPYDMTQTGYYQLDRLPANCAQGYIWDEQHDEYYTNIYSIDAKGSGAGGAFTTGGDAHKFWQGLLNDQRIDDAIRSKLLQPLVDECYSYGLWFLEPTRPYFIGFDPGTRFISSYNLMTKHNITIISNKEFPIGTLHKAIKAYLDK